MSNESPGWLRAEGPLTAYPTPSTQVWYYLTHWREVMDGLHGTVYKVIYA